MMEVGFHLMDRYHLGSYSRHADSGGERNQCLTETLLPVTAEHADEHGQQESLTLASSPETLRAKHARAAGYVLRAVAERERQLGEVHRSARFYSQDHPMRSRSAADETCLPSVTAKRDGELRDIGGASLATKRKSRSSHVDKLPVPFSLDMGAVHQQSSPSAKELFVALSSPALPMLPLPFLPPPAEDQQSPRGSAITAFDVAWPGTAVGLENRISRA
eukprot:SAG11_NODE_888_length_6693_cov_2.506218_5_plen_219_part_00